MCGRSQLLFWMHLNETALVMLTWPAVNTCDVLYLWRRMNKKQWYSNCRNNNLPFNFTLISKQTSSSYCIYIWGNENERFKKFFENLMTLMIWFTWTSRNSYTHSKSCEHTQTHANWASLTESHPALPPAWRLQAQIWKGFVWPEEVLAGDTVYVCVWCVRACVCVCRRTTETDRQ